MIREKYSSLGVSEGLSHVSISECLRDLLIAGIKKNKGITQEKFERIVSRSRYWDKVVIEVPRAKPMPMAAGSSIC
jgi:hypothetical protein